MVLVLQLMNISIPSCNDVKTNDTTELNETLDYLTHSVVAATQLWPFIYYDNITALSERRCRIWIWTSLLTPVFSSEFSLEASPGIGRGAGMAGTAPA